jgi:hypothetical protein
VIHRHRAVRRALGMGDSLGTIGAGKLADLLVLDRGSTTVSELYATSPTSSKAVRSSSFDATWDPPARAAGVTARLTLECRASAPSEHVWSPATFRGCVLTLIRCATRFYPGVQAAAGCDGTGCRKCAVVRSLAFAAPLLSYAALDRPLVLRSS